jgi:putative zinc finger/helix-turn-helix YgiT family protein
MICLNCDSEHFSAGEAEVKQEFKGQALTVNTPVMICQTCGWQTVGNDQIDELRRRTADTYRKARNLLTSAQIRAMREALGKTQRQFAAFLRVGEASVKRWETWLVQDAGNDELIRVKCVLAKKAHLLKRVTQTLLENRAAVMTQTVRLQTAEAESLLATLSRYVNTGETIWDATSPPTLAEPVTPSPLQFFTQRLRWSPQAVQAPELAFTQIGAIQFQRLPTDYTTYQRPCTPWLRGLPQEEPQRPPSRQTTLNHRSDLCNDPTLAAAA